MKTLAELQTAEHEYIKGHGGYWELSEYKRRINKFSRAKVRAFRRGHGEAWLGNVNFYPETPPNYTKYTNGIVRNFEYRFIISQPDAELQNLITQRNEADYTGTKADFSRVDAIFNKIEELGGIVLNWV